MAYYGEMKRRRSKSLERRGPDLAEAVSGCSPSPRNKRTPQPGISALVLAGALDKKYNELGRKWQEEEGIEFEVINNVGHALLVEAPFLVAATIARFLSKKESKSKTPIDGVRRPKESSGSSILLDSDKTKNRVELSMSFHPFSLLLIDSSGQSKGVAGIGWGEKAKSSRKLLSRKVFLCELHQH
jgi:hypothetical protein